MASVRRHHAAQLSAELLTHAHTTYHSHSPTSLSLSDDHITSRDQCPLLRLMQVPARKSCKIVLLSQQLRAEPHSASHEIASYVTADHFKGFQYWRHISIVKSDCVPRTSSRLARPRSPTALSHVTADFQGVSTQRHDNGSGCMFPGRHRDWLSHRPPTA